MKIVVDVAQSPLLAGIKEAIDIVHYLRDSLEPLTKSYKPEIKDVDGGAVCKECPSLCQVEEAVVVGGLDAQSVEVWFEHVDVAENMPVAEEVV